MLKSGFFYFAAGLCFMLIVGWFVFPGVLYERIEQPLQFSHKIHTGQTAALACTDCHEIKADGRFTGIPLLEKCASCHQSAIGASPHEKKLVDEFVSKNREIQWLVYARQPQNVYFSHASHIKLGSIECSECHGDHGSSESLRAYERNRISGYSRDIDGQSIVRFSSRASWDGKKMGDCIDCHDRHAVANTCLKCHK